MAPLFGKKEKDEPESAPELDNQVLDMMGLPPSDAPAQTAEMQSINAIQVMDKEGQTDKIVDDIIASESDELLKSEDEKVAKAFDPKNKESKKSLLKRWWQNKRLRNSTLGLIFAGLVVLFALPTSRYLVLNAAGVKASASMIVIDKNSGRPIKNVQVTLGGVESLTDKDGKVSFSGVKLGEQELIFKKRSFSEQKQNVVIGWGSNPYNAPFELTPTGTTYTFVATDWLSGKPIAKAEVTDGESVAIADENGKAELTIQPTEDEITLKIKADGYREETFDTSKSDGTEKKVSLVVSTPHVFVSKRSGNYVLYKNDADGKNEKILMESTGKERSDIAVSQNSTGTQAAYVSTRDGAHNKEGYTLSSLYIVDLKTDQATKLASSERIQLVGWTNESLVYVRVAEGASAANEKRERLIAYDFNLNKEQELASANGIGQVNLIDKTIYYVANNAPGSNLTSGMYKINVDGSEKSTVVSKDIWGVFRVSYERFNINVANNQWYDYKLADSKANPLATPPAAPVNKAYVTNESDSKSVWVDKRDGKGVLVLYNVNGGKEITLVNKAGLNYPVQWLSDHHIVFRVSSGDETADYVINIDGGSAHKINDVTNTDTFQNWYAY